MLRFQNTKSSLTIKMLSRARGKGLIEKRIIRLTNYCTCIHALPYVSLWYSCWRSCYTAQQLAPGWDPRGLLILKLTAVWDLTIQHTPRQMSSWLQGEIQGGFWFSNWQLFEILPYSTHLGRWAAGSRERSTEASDSQFDSCLRSYNTAHT